MYKKRFYSKYPMLFMAPDNGVTGGGSGTGDGGNTNTGDGVNTGNTGDGGQGNTGGQGGNTTETKTFSQAEIDKIIKDRLDRERKKFEGVDVDEYKKMKAEAQAKADAEKTELEKVQDKLNKAEKEKEEALSLANQRLIRAEFKMIAQQKGIKYVDDAYKLSDLGTVTVKEDGTIEGMVEIIDSLVKDKPFLVEVTGGTGKVDTKSKNDKTNNNVSIGEQLANLKKEQLKSQTDLSNNYFK